MSAVPRVDFYLLQVGSRELLACKLAEKAYLLGHKIYVHTASAQAAAALDDLLWTFRDGSFLPHSLVDQQDTLAPVLLGYGNASPPQADLLINLSDAVPEFFHCFARVAEPVDPDEQRKADARARYRVYKDHGCELMTHTLTA